MTPLQPPGWHKPTTDLSYASLSTPLCFKVIGTHCLCSRHREERGAAAAAAGHPGRQAGGLPLNIRLFGVAPGLRGGAPRCLLGFSRLQVILMASVSPAGWPPAEHLTPGAALLLSALSAGRGLNNGRHSILLCCRVRQRGCDPVSQPSTRCAAPKCSACWPLSACNACMLLCCATGEVLVVCSATHLQPTGFCAPLWKVGFIL